MSARPSAAGASYTAAPDTDDTVWQLLARCRDYEPEIFFPEGHQMEAKSRQAINICHQCPVENQCAEWALTRGEQFGVWGGMSEITREALLTGHRRNTRRIA
jgi:WhiB family redox-sensing transcriptional regulator